MQNSIMCDVFKVPAMILALGPESDSLSVRRKKELQANQANEYREWDRKKRERKNQDMLPIVIHPRFCFHSPSSSSLSRKFANSSPESSSTTSASKTLLLLTTRSQDMIMLLLVNVVIHLIYDDTNTNADTNHDQQQ